MTASRAASPSGRRRTFAPLPSTVTVALRRSTSRTIETAALADPQAGAVEQLQHRQVAAGGRQFGIRGRVQQRVRVVGPRDPRQAPHTLGRAQVDRHIALQNP